MSDSNQHSTLFDVDAARDFANGVADSAQQGAPVDLMRRDMLAACAEIERLVEQLETLRRHDEAATQDAVFFRKQLVDTQEQLEARDDLLRRLREWDMLNSYIGGDGERHEPTADAPYWRNEIDRVRGSNPASMPSMADYPDAVPGGPVTHPAIVSEGDQAAGRASADSIPDRSPSETVASSPATRPEIRIPLSDDMIEELELDRDPASGPLGSDVFLETTAEEGP